MRKLLSCLSLILAMASPVMAVTLQVGPGYTYATLAAAATAASAGDTILMHGGPAGYTYTDQVATITKALTITGVNDGFGLPTFNQTPGTESPNYKGYLIIQADVTLTNLIFQNAAITEGNGGNAAGIRQESGNLTVVDSQFINNQNGILSTPGVDNTGSLTVIGSLFSGNGSGTGYTHAIYANRLASLTVNNGIFTGTNIGHDIKSRAANNFISGNSLDDGVTGTTSYAIDLPNGGNATIRNNTITQGNNTDNWTMIAYGSEGLIWASNTASITGNTFTNFNPGDQTVGVKNFADSGTNLSVTGNTFCGLAYDVQGPASVSGNTSSAGPCAIPAPPLGLAWAAGIALCGLIQRGRLSPA
jgi:hypothetical protein